MPDCRPASYDITTTIISGSSDLSGSKIDRISHGKILYFMFQKINFSLGSSLLVQFLLKTSFLYFILKKVISLSGLFSLRLPGKVTLLTGKSPNNLDYPPRNRRVGTWPTESQSG